MGPPKTDYQTYARRPTADGLADLKVKIFRPIEAIGPLPLLIWFHSGGFRSGDIDASTHDRLARLMAEHGYACAFVQYRLGARFEDLGQQAQEILPELLADAKSRASDINKAFVGARAIAATEDAAAFLKWAQVNKEEQGFSGHYVLGGSSAGGMIVLNLLNLAPQLGFELPEIASAIVVSGAFAYPSYFRAPTTRTLAIMGRKETQMPISSIRAYAYMLPETCTLLEHDDHQHGDARVTRQESVRRAVRRFVLFDRGKKIKSGRLDRPNNKPKRAYSFCIFTCVRNEGPFLLEWLAHNRAIGVTDFVIFSNDCDDGTTELLDALDRRGIVKHVPNPSSALDSDQHLGLTVHCAQYTKEFRRSDYAILTDIDEFIQINVADRTLNGLLAAAGHPDVMSLSEVLYGFGGVEGFKDDLVTTQFQISENSENRRRGVKSIVRVSQDVASYSNHRPQMKHHALDRVEWVDGAGKPVPLDFILEGKRGFDVEGRYPLARVNHYTLRSGESMLVKFERGDSVRPGRMRKKYFRERNGRSACNKGFLPHVPAIEDELGKLLREPEILELHNLSVTKHRAKIEVLKASEEFAPIWKAICRELEEPLPGNANSLQQAAE